MTSKANKSAAQIRKEGALLDAFLRQYVQHRNGARAAREAARECGATVKNPAATAARWLELPEAQDFLDRYGVEVRKAGIMTAVEMRERLSEIARGETIRKIGVGEDAQYVEGREKTSDSLKAIETLAKLDGLFIEKVDSNVTVRVVVEEETADGKPQDA